MNTIVPERPDQRAAIRAVSTEAFPTAGEADLVEDLRRAQAMPVALVCSHGDAILGHIAFSPISIVPNASPAVIWALAPLVVATAAQGSGIGSALVRTGLQACRDAGCDVVVVLGAPGFYSRFGFRPAADYGLRCSFDAPPEAFMLIELRPDALSVQPGTVRFHAAFDRFI